MRQLLFVSLLVAAILLVLVACLTPSHFRAADAKVLQRAGAGTLSATQLGINLALQEKPGPAKLLFQAAEQLNLPDREKIGPVLQTFKNFDLNVRLWGAPDPYLDRVYQGKSIDRWAGFSLLEFLVTQENRDLLRNDLSQSRQPAVVAVLQTRSWTNLTQFLPVQSASGQPLDTSILLTALLIQRGHVTDPLRDTIHNLANVANQKGKAEQLEEIYLDVLSLARRFDLAQLTYFLRQVKDPAVLRDLTHLARLAESNLPVFYAMVAMTESPADLSKYLMRFGKSGQGDARFALQNGKGALDMLMVRQQPVYYGKYRSYIANLPGVASMFRGLVNVSFSHPLFMLVLKMSYLFIGGFLIVNAFRFYGTPPSPEEQRLEVGGGLALARRGAVTVMLTTLLVLLAEPFLAQADQQLEFPLRWQFTMLADALTNNVITQQTATKDMDQITLLAFFLFLVIQLIIYILCLIKLAEIRRQPIPSLMKLKLIDNEDLLFDAGLYCGLGGSVGSLLFLSMGIIKPSLMAAYSSTLFGIVFVAVLKIFHVRPLRRKLLLEVEPPKA